MTTRYSLQRPTTSKDANCLRIERHLGDPLDAAGVHTPHEEIPSVTDLIRLERARCRALIELLDELRDPVVKIKASPREDQQDTARADARVRELADSVEAGLNRAIRMLESELQTGWSEPDLNEMVRTLYVRKEAAPSPVRSRERITSREEDGPAPSGERSDTEWGNPPADLDPKTTVLIVDDHASTRAFLRHAVAKYHRVIEAGDAESALELIREHRPDLIMSDIMMPGMDGSELCRTIKSDPELKHIPVFLITANPVRSLRNEGLASGADDYLTKPVDIREAVMRINNEIRSHEELRRRYRREVVIKPSDITVTSEDEAFITRTREVVEEHMGDAQFTVQDLAARMHLSARQLQRRLRETVDQSPVEFMRTLRLQRAAQLLEGRYGNVSEVAYSVGFTSLSYFAKCFREEYGVSPSEFKEKRR